MSADSLHRHACSERAVRALASLRGLAVGDALGSQFFVPAHHALPRRSELPPGTWQWTDDTEMACSVVAVMAAT
ncbi:ADP-ribosylglycohydrolase family protein, partial [Streptomyces boncukensis]